LKLVKAALSWQVVTETPGKGFAAPARGFHSDIIRGVLPRRHLRPPPLGGLTPTPVRAALNPVPVIPNPDPALVEAFIARWDGTAMAERANAQPFLSELCDVLGVPRPDPAQGGIGPYRFERNVTHHEADGTATTRRIDLYRRACFVCEA